MDQFIQAACRVGVGGQAETFPGSSSGLMGPKSLLFPSAAPSGRTGGLLLASQSRSGPWEAKEPGVRPTGLRARICVIHRILNRPQTCSPTVSLQTVQNSGDGGGLGAAGLSGEVDGVGSGGRIESNCPRVEDFFQGDDSGLQLIVLMAAPLNT